MRTTLNGGAQYFFLNPRSKHLWAITGGLIFVGYVTKTAAWIAVRDQVVKQG